MLPVRTIAVLNQKGGVGKTTTVANLGAAVAARGYKVCLIDMDPQSHLTLHFGIEPGESQSSMYDVLTADAPLLDAAVEISPSLSVVPAVIDLAATEVELASTIGREQILRDRLADTNNRFDFVIIDCPPSLGLLTLNSLAAADEVVIPLQPHFLALQGLGKLLETVSLVRQRINHHLTVAGVILCMYESNTRLASEVVADLKEFFNSVRDRHTPWSDTRIFETFIRRNIKLAECPSYGTTIFDYEPASKGAEDYAALADEFLKLYAADRPAEQPSAEPAAEQPTQEAQPEPADTPEPETPPQAADNTAVEATQQQ